MIDATFSKVNGQTAVPGGPRRHPMRSSLLLVGLLAAGVTLWTTATRPSPSDRWIETMRARGEVFTFEELGLDRPTPVDPVLEVLDQSVGQLDRRNLWHSCS